MNNINDNIQNRKEVIQERLKQLDEELVASENQQMTIKILKSLGQ